MEDQTTTINDLPLEILSQVISLNSPADCIRCAAVSPLWCHASDSDGVWEKQLPPDYQQIISRLDIRPRYTSKKELYFHLCHPCTIDHQKRLFWLDRATGKKCYMVFARELHIAWGDDERYWKWVTVEGVHTHGSFSLEVAKLLVVCWLDIFGFFESSLLSSDTCYAAYLVLRIDPDAYGLSHVPPTVSVTLGSHISTGKALLDVDHAGQTSDERSGSSSRGLPGLFNRGRRPIQATQTKFLRDRGDGWMELELGEFFNETGEDGEVKMQLDETKSGHSKRGLVIHGIQIRPERKSQS